MFRTRNHRWLLAAALVLGTLTAPVAVRAQDGEEPTAAQKYFISGTELMQNFRYLDAAEQFRLAIDEDPEYIDAYSSLAHVFTEMAKTEAEYYEDALELYEELEEKQPEQVDIKVRKAYVLTQLDEIEDAVATYDEILVITPEDCSAWGRQAELYNMLAEKAGEGTEGYEAAMTSSIDAYKEITTVCPEEMYAYNKLGEIYFNMGNTDAAGDVYERLLEQDTENVDIMGRLGYLYYNAGKSTKDKSAALVLFEKANPRFKKLLELDPERYQYQGIYADCLKRSGHPVESAKEYLKLIEATGNLSLYCNCGFTFLDAKDYEAAIEMAMKAISENAPEKGCLYSIWGKGLELRGTDQVQGYGFDRGISTYTDAKDKFGKAQGDPKFGDFATKQISRLDQLIDRARSLKLKDAQGGDRD